MKLTSERLEQIKEGAGPSAQECAAMVAEIQASREHIPTTEGQGGGEELATRLRRARLNGLFDPSLALQLPDDNEQVDQLLDAIEDRLLSSPRVEEVRREAIEIALAESMKGPLSQDHPWDRGYRAGAAAVWSKLRALSLYRLDRTPSHVHSLRNHDHDLVVQLLHAADGVFRQNVQHDDRVPGRSGGVPRA